MSMSKELKCRVCGKPVAKITMGFERRMSLLREHYKKYHPAAFKKSIRKSAETRKRRKKR